MMKMRLIKRNKWLNGKIKKNWDSLSDEEIAFYQENPEAFYSAVKKKYGMFKGDVESSIRKLKSGYGFFAWRD